MIQVKLLTFEEYSNLLIHNPSSNTLHQLIVEFYDGRIEPFTMQFGPLYNSRYNKDFRVWEVQKVYDCIREISKSHEWGSLTAEGVLRDTLRSLLTHNEDIAKVLVGKEVYQIRIVHKDLTNHVFVFEVSEFVAGSVSHLKTFCSSYNPASSKSMIDSLVESIQSNVPKFGKGVKS